MEAEEGARFFSLFSDEDEPNTSQQAGSRDVVCLGYCTHVPRFPISLEQMQQLDKAPEPGVRIQCRVLRGGLPYSGRTEFTLYVETRGRRGIFCLGAVVDRKIWGKTEMAVASQRPDSPAFNGKKILVLETEKRKKRFGFYTGSCIGSVFYASNEEPRDFVVSLPSPSTGHAIQLENKKPQWSNEFQAYVLNFGGRVAVSSTKNVQVISSNDPASIALQMGKQDDDVFVLDFEYPFNMLQAFAVFLSVFYNKMV